MKTPITNAALEAWANGGTSSDTIIPAMRRLELDRAIFRQALIDIYLSPAADSREIANKALQAASKFEGETHEP